MLKSIMKINILTQGNICNRFILPLSHSLSAGEFKTGRLPMFQANSLVDKRVWANLRRGKMVCKCRRAKIPRRKKKTLNTVYFELQGTCI